MYKGDNTAKRVHNVLCICKLRRRRDRDRGGDSDDELDNSMSRRRSKRSRDSDDEDERDSRSRRSTGKPFILLKIQDFKFFIKLILVTQLDLLKQATTLKGHLAFYGHIFICHLKINDC